MEVKVEKEEKKKVLGGRPLHEGWQLYHFEKLHGEKGKLVARCLKCKNTIQNTTISRFISHRKKCGNLSALPAATSTPVQIPTPHLHQPQQEVNKLELEDFSGQVIQEQPQTQTILWSSDQVENYVDESVNPSTIDIINEDINRHRKSSSSKKSKIDLDVALSSFLISCNLTFDLVDSKHFKNFVNALNPEYKIPTSSQLTARVLYQLKGGDGSGNPENFRVKKRRYYSSDDSD